VLFVLPCWSIPRERRKSKKRKEQTNQKAKKPKTNLGRSKICRRTLPAGA
jgi:hypothetical protein